MRAGKGERPAPKLIIYVLYTLNIWDEMKLMPRTKLASTGLNKSLAKVYFKSFLLWNNLRYGMDSQLTPSPSLLTFLACFYNGYSVLKCISLPYKVYNLKTVKYEILPYGNGFINLPKDYVSWKVFYTFHSKVDVYIYIIYSEVRNSFKGPGPNLNNFTQ